MVPQKLKTPLSACKSCLSQKLSRPLKTERKAKAFSTSIRKITLHKITSTLIKQISCAESRDPELRRLKHLLTSLSETRAKIEVRPMSLAEIERQWKFDRLQGRATSYYTLEEQVLTADLHYVTAVHNREVVSERIERRRRELAWEVARDFWPLWSLDEDERRAVLALAGVRVPSPHAGPQPLPLEAAAQYAVRVRGSRRVDDDWEPNPEVLEVMEGWQERFSEGLRRMAVAEAGAGGKLEKGKKLMVMFGSSGRNYPKGTVPKGSNSAASSSAGQIPKWGLAICRQLLISGFTEDRAALARSGKGGCGSGPVLPHEGEREEPAPGCLERLMARVAAVEDLLFAASPASFPPGDPHARPSTLEEAARVLKKLGIWNAVPLRTYLSGTPHQDYGEPLGRCQVVEAHVAGREVHFYLRYCRRGKRGGWRVAGAFAASNFCPKTDWEEALGKAPRPEKFDFAANGLTPSARVRVKFDTTVAAHSVTEITGKVEGLYPDFAVIRSGGGVPVTVHRTDIACGFAKISRM